MYCLNIGDSGGSRGVTDKLAKCTLIEEKRREGVGVEPTDAGSAPPPTNFEDWGIHRDTSPPTSIVLDGAAKCKHT